MNIHITLNGAARSAPAGTTVAALVAEIGLAGKRLAVEVNGDVVPRTQHGATRLADGDRVEVVRAIGGG